MRVDLARQIAALLSRYGLHVLFREVTADLLVVSQVGLRADQHDRNLPAEVVQLRHPLVCDVLEAVWVVDGEAQKEDVGVGVGERPQTVVVLLTRRVPQRQFYQGAVHLITQDKH